MVNRNLAVFWFFALLLSQYGIDAISALQDGSIATLRAWTYVFQHLETAFAFGTIAYLAGRYSLLLPLCFWGGIEHLEGAGCRLLFPMEAPPPKTEALQGLCDIATGLPVYGISAGLVLLGVIFWYQETREKVTL